MPLGTNPINPFYFIEKSLPLFFSTYHEMPKDIAIMDNRENVKKSGVFPHLPLNFIAPFIEHFPKSLKRGNIGKHFPLPLRYVDTPYPHPPIRQHIGQNLLRVKIW